MQAVVALTFSADMLVNRQLALILEETMSINDLISSGNDIYIFLHDPMEERAYDFEATQWEEIIETTEQFESNWIIRIEKVKRHCNLPS